MTQIRPQAPMPCPEAVPELARRPRSDGALAIEDSLPRRAKL